MIDRAVVLLEHPDDAHALRAAVAIAPTTALSVAVSGEAGVSLLRAALAAGATRAIRIWDESLRGTDYLGIAHALAATLRVLEDETGSQSVVLCGDRGRGAVGPAVAERLGVPHLTGVTSLVRNEGQLLIRRPAGAVIRLYGAQGTVVICVPPAGARLEPVAAGATANQGEIEDRSLAAVGVSAAELSYRRRFSLHPRPGPTPAPLRLRDGQALVDRLRAEGLIPKAED